MNHGLPVDDPGRVGKATHESLHAVVGLRLGREIDTIVMEPEVAGYLSRNVAAACVSWEPVAVGDEIEAGLPALAALLAPARAGCWGTAVDLENAAKLTRSLALYADVSETELRLGAERLVDSLLDDPKVIDAVEWLAAKLLTRPWIDGDEVRRHLQMTAAFGAKMEQGGKHVS